MGEKEVNEDKISKNFIFFDFRDISFHNYGQMFPKDKLPIAKEDDTDDTSLNCSPDTDAAIQDALEEIIRDLSGEKIEESDIKLFDDAGNNFNKFTSWLSEKKEINEYEKYIKKNIKNFASKKHKESDELCKKVFESLFNPVNFQEFQENIKERITDFLNKERISADDSNKKKYLLKYLNVLLRTIPQPWNALAGGAISKHLINPELEDENIKYDYPAYLINDISKISDIDSEIPSEYKDIVKHIQFYLEYALVINTPDKWERPGPKRKNAQPQISMIVFPLIDNGFFRGYYYLFSSNTQQIEAIRKEKLKQYGEKCLFFTDSLRSAHETEMMDILFREKGVNEGEEEREKDIYRRILKNLHYIQEVSLGSLWMVNGDSLTQRYVTGYGRDFKEKPENDKNPGIYLYKGYEGYEAFIKAKNSEANSECNIKKEEENLARKLNKLFRNPKDKKEFYGNYPKCFYFKNNFNSEWIRASSEGSYYKQSSLDIKWRLTLPVVRGDELKAIYFLYYRDPIVMHADKFTLLTKVKDVNMQKSLRKEIFGLRARQVMKFFSAIEVYEERKNEIIKHGTRAAVAAIMARNMSHNLGSHILSYLSSESQSDGKFYRYLQGRMDFIADISTRKPSWSSTVSFIEDIINPFVGSFVEVGVIHSISPDTNAKIINNILRSIAINDGNERICLDVKKINIIVNIAVDGSNAIESTCQIVYRKPPNENKYFYKKPNDFRDISLDVPHGSVGMHAFYSILENFLRNSAKHGGDGVNEILRDKNKQFECCIKIVSDDKYKSLYKVTIRDNIKKANPSAAKKKIDSYITGVDSRLINNDGDINREGWGIKEMRISAAWLRGVDAKEVQNYSLEPLLLTTIITENDELGYEFYLLKPLEVLIVTKDSSIKANPNEGIYIKNTADELSGLIKNNTLRHKCVVFDNPDDGIIEWIQENLISLPFSTFCNVSLKNCSAFMYKINRNTYCNGNVKNNLYAELRKNVVNKYCANEAIKLCFFEDTLRTISEEKNISAITHLEDITNRCIVFNHDYKEKDSFELKEIYNNKPVFYQTFSSTDTTGRRILELLKKEGKYGIDKIYIGALSKIVFADERLFSKMQTMSENEYLYKKWERMGVEFIDIKCDHDKVIVSTNSENSPIDWNLYIDQKSNQITFFSIHQSTIKDVITEKSWGKMAADLNKNNIFITIHTGRAAINVTSGFKYLEFSNIENILDNFDKLRLAELFFHEVRGSE